MVCFKIVRLENTEKELYRVQISGGIRNIWFGVDVDVPELFQLKIALKKVLGDVLGDGL